MKRKHWYAFVLLLVICCSVVYAHPGRTDSSGGHHDRQNGGYHYHHGMEAHQHPDGVCLYGRTEPALTPTVSPTILPTDKPISEVVPSVTIKPINKTISIQKTEDSTKENNDNFILLIVLVVITVVISVINSSANDKKSSTGKVLTPKEEFTTALLAIIMALGILAVVGLFIYGIFAGGGWLLNRFTPWLAKNLPVLILLFIIASGVIGTLGYLLFLIAFPIWGVIGSLIEKFKNKKSHITSELKQDEIALSLPVADTQLNTINHNIPDGYAIGDDGLPYKINREYGWGREFNVFVTENGKHYHRSRCTLIKGEKKALIHRYNAIEKYEPCSHCKPKNYIDEWYTKNNKH